MKFEIINPSDPYTIEADDLEIAAVAVSLLGDGKYPLVGLGDAAGQDMPPFLFGGHDEWFIENFGGDFEEVGRKVITHRLDALIHSFDSVKLEVAQRSSINDIGGYAASWAERLRKRQAT